MGYNLYDLTNFFREKSGQSILDFDTYNALVAAHKMYPFIIWLEMYP